MGLIFPKESIRTIGRPNVTTLNWVVVLLIIYEERGGYVSCVRLSGIWFRHQILISEEIRVVLLLWRNRSANVTLITQLVLIWIDHSINARQWYIGEVCKIFTDGNIQGVRTVEDIRVGLKISSPPRRLVLSISVDGIKGVSTSTGV